MKYLVLFSMLFLLVFSSCVLSSKDVLRVNDDPQAKYQRAGYSSHAVIHLENETLRLLPGRYIVTSTETGPKFTPAKENEQANAILRPVHYYPAGE